MKPPKFKFRLEKVKKFRELIKKQAEQEVMLRTQDFQSAEETMQLIVEERNRNKVENDEILTAADYQLVGIYNDFLENLIEHQVEVVKKTEEDLAVAKEIFIEKAKEEKALVLLKDKKKEEFDEEEKVRVKKEISEIAILMDKRNLK